MLNAAILVCLVVAAQEKGKGPVELEPGDLLPGLVAKYQSLVDKEATLYRVEPKPAFYLGRSSPHPRIPPGPFQVEWTGVIQSRNTGHSLGVRGRELMVKVDGETVLDGRGRTDTTRLTAKAPIARRVLHVAVKYQFADVPYVAGVV